MTPSISVACFDKGVWIRVTGRGCFECSANLKEYVMIMIQKDYHEFVIDLINCEQMDSTFMGTITGLAQRLRQDEQGTLRVINVSEKNEQLIENLGLNHLFLLQPLSLGYESPPVGDNLRFCTAIAPCQNDKKSLRRELLLSSHKALVAANKANAAKFQDLFELIY